MNKTYYIRIRTLLLFVILLTIILAGCSAKKDTTAANQGQAAGTAGETGTAAGSGSERDTDTAADPNTAAASGESGNYRDVLNVAITQQAATYDLHKLSSNASKMICNGNVFEKLVTLDKDGNSVPELAEKYEISDDGKEFTFYLRKGVKFHDGTEMTAKDVAASMNRWIESFSNASAIAGDSRFEEVDQYTVKITLLSPAITFIDVIAGAGQPAAITTAAACANEDENGFLKEYIGTGPYKFAEWAQDQYIRLERFEDYVPYGDPSVLDNGWAGYKYAKTPTINYYYVPDAATRAAGLKTGQYDVIFGLTEDNFDSVKNTEGLVTGTVPNGITTITFNKRQGPATDPYLRKAINAAVNCEDLMRSENGDNFELDSSYMDKSQIWYSTAGSEYYNQHDLAKANEYLKQSAYKGETLRILTTDDSSIATVLQQQLADAGINTEILSYDFATFSQLRNDPTTFDLITGGWITHPIPPLKPFLAPDFVGWADDKTLQDYFTEFYAAKSIEDAKAVWDKAQLYCWQDYLPIINVGHKFDTYAWSDKVEDVVIKDGLFFWNATVTK